MTGQQRFEEPGSSGVIVARAHVRILEPQRLLVPRGNLYLNLTFSKAVRAHGTVREGLGRRPVSGLSCWERSLEPSLPETREARGSCKRLPEPSLPGFLRPEQIQSYFSILWAKFQIVSSSCKAKFMLR